MILTEALYIGKYRIIVSSLSSLTGNISMRYKMHTLERKEVKDIVAPDWRILHEFKV